jgi:hypothetical protein
VTSLPRLLVLACALLAPPLPGQTMSHAAFDSLLRAHVHDGLVDYDAFAASPRFREYLALLGATDPGRLSRDEQVAYWINAYNAYTIELINRHHERRSIRNINRTLGFIRAYGPWNESLVSAGGRMYTLDQVEQEILRPRYGEPRIHFALVCAARGCPPLRSEAYSGARLDQQLDDQARRFLLHSPAKNRVETATRTVYLSPIFHFRDYARDFGGSEAAVGRYIARYHPPGAERALLESGRFAVRYTHYDWSLNLAP